MKKVLLSIMLVICVVSYVPAQEVTTKLGQGELIPNSHLSVSLKAGGSYFRTGGPQYNGPDFFFDRSRLDLTSVVGGTIEYTFTPIFGLGLDLSYVGNSRWSDFNKDMVKDNYLKGGTKDAALYASLNLANIIAPNRTGFWSKVSLYGNAGAGMGFYHYETGIHKSLSNASTFLALGGFNLEYNINKAFAIGAEMQYRYYAKDDMGYYANYSPKGFSDAAIATLGLRYKIPYKDRKHVRNINALEYVPLDGDNDGIPDTQDKCSDTPAGVTVDASGCPVDGDADGVADYLDKCAGTPAGVKVDASGCPVDADKDGVADYLDKCPASPVGVAVDKQGCPVDTDKDGIADYLDKCPTVAGVASQNGCPEVVVEKSVLPNLPKVMAISNFVTGSAELVKKFDPILNDLVTFLKANPTTSVELQGNADNRGEEDPNYTLSVRRAKAAAAYLVKNGIKADRISTVGFGETKPVATNDTVEGRAANRNCTFVLTSK